MTMSLGHPMYINGQLVERPMTITHAPTAGLGEYFEQPPMAGLGEPLQTGPGRAFEDGSLGLPLQQGPGRTFQDGSLGATVVRQPTKGAQLARRLSPLAGALGQVNDAVQATKVPSPSMPERRAAPAAAIAVAGTIAVVYLTVFGVTGYYAGKAMAPKSKGMGTAGAIVNILFGGVGLGIMGAVKLASKD